MINIRHSLLLTLCLPSFVYAHPVTNQESDETVKDSPLSDEDLKTFKMTGEFGLIATTGNTDTSTFKGKITAHHELEHWSNDYQLEGFYKQETSEDENGHDDTDVSAEKYFGSVQANYKLDNPDHRTFLYYSYQKDRFSSYDYQSTLAAGWNQRLWHDDTSAFDYSVGPGYTFARTVEGRNMNSPILRASFDYQRALSSTATFEQAFSTEIGTHNTRSKAETSITAKIADPLSMKISITLDHNTDVDDDVDNLDTETAVTLLYTFF